MYARAVIILTFVAIAYSEYVKRKHCKDVAATQCNVHSVNVEPCSGGPDFCVLDWNKSSMLLNVDLTPQFTASDVKLAMFADDKNDESFASALKATRADCHTPPCPIGNGVRRTIDVHFNVNKALPRSKFPMKVKIWNGDDESQACCFTFKVKVHK